MLTSENETNCAEPNPKPFHRKLFWYTLLVDGLDCDYNWIGLRLQLPTGPELCNIKIGCNRHMGGICTARPNSFKGIGWWLLTQPNVSRSDAKQL